MSNNLEEIEAKLLLVSDAIVEIDETLTKDYACLGGKELGVAYTRLVGVRLKVLEEIQLRKRWAKMNEGFDK